MANQIIPDSTKLNSDDYFTQRKFEMMIEMSTKKFVSEITTLKSMLSSLNEEVSTLKKQFNDIRCDDSRRAEPVISNNSFARNESQYSEQPRFNQSSQRNDAPKPRFGDYTPEDVSITKMFYFGNKR